LRGLCKYYGGKQRLAKYIIPHLPSHTEYYELFGGAGSVLVNKKPSKFELYNELDDRMYNLMCQVQCNSDYLIKELKKVEFSLETFKDACDKIKNCQLGYEESIYFYIVKNMSRCGIGESGSFSPDRENGHDKTNAWNTAIDNIKNVSKRLKDVKLKNYNALEFLDDNSFYKNSLIYLDPPYVASTRKSSNNYKYEMTNDQHIEMATKLNKLNCKIVISGYESDLYNNLYKDWRKIQIKSKNYAGNQSGTRLDKVEVLWIKD